MTRVDAIENVAVQLTEAARILSDLRQTDVFEHNDFERWDLAWQLQTTLHNALYPLFRLVNDEHDQPYQRRAS